MICQIILVLVVTTGTDITTFLRLTTGCGEMTPARKEWVMVGNAEPNYVVTKDSKGQTRWSKKLSEPVLVTVSMTDKEYVKHLTDFSTQLDKLNLAVCKKYVSQETRVWDSNSDRTWLNPHNLPPSKPYEFPERKRKGRRPKGFTPGKGQFKLGKQARVIRVTRSSKHVSTDDNVTATQVPNVTNMNDLGNRISDDIRAPDSDDESDTENVPTAEEVGM